MTKKLTKSTTDKRLVGVCGGLSEYFGFDSTLVRAGWAILTVATGFPGVIIYAVMAIVMPKGDELITISNK